MGKRIISRARGHGGPRYLSPGHRFVSEVSYGFENAVVVEGMTSVLINLNIKHKVKAAGIRITGIPRP